MTGQMAGYRFPSPTPLAVTVGTREQILGQVSAILSGLPSYNGAPVPVFRNRGDIEDISRPAIVLLDGAERNISPGQEDGKTVRLRPATILLSPQIFVLLKERDTAMNDTIANVPAPVGDELNYWIDAIRGGLAADPTLMQLLTPNGQVIYRGCWTDMQTGSTLIGELRLFIDLMYVWLPPA